MMWVGDHSDREFHAAKPAGPDMTEPIMQRLGFVRVRAGEFRSMKRRRWFERVLVLVAFVGIVGVGVYAHGLSSRARTASEMSIPEAFDEISNRTTGINETLRQASLLWSPSERTSGELALGVKPASKSAEQKSKVPWSDLFD